MKRWHQRGRGIWQWQGVKDKWVVKWKNLLHHPLHLENSYSYAFAIWSCKSSKGGHKQWLCVHQASFTDPLPGHGPLPNQVLPRQFFFLNHAKPNVDSHQLRATLQVILRLLFLLWGCPPRAPGQDPWVPAGSTAGPHFFPRTTGLYCNLFESILHYILPLLFAMSGTIVSHIRHIYFSSNI